MRNRRAHTVSLTDVITAREAYQVAEQACRFFELMRDPRAPPEIHREFRQLRRTALQMLFVEELHAEHREAAEAAQ